MENEILKPYICENCQEYLSENEAYNHNCFQLEISSTHKNNDIDKNELQVNDSQIQCQNSTREELLISLMADRRPLWDHTLKLSDRSKTIRDRLWAEIEEILDCDWTIDVIQRKWKSLKDRYFRVKHEIEEYVPSGSGAHGKKSSWKYYEMLKFLSDVNVPRATTSSSSYTEIKENVPQVLELKPQKEKQKKCSRNMDEEILQAIKETVPLVATNPKINPVCLALSDIMTELPIHKRAKLEMEFLKMAYEARLTD